MSDLKNVSIQESIKEELEENFANLDSACTVSKLVALKNAGETMITAEKLAKAKQHSGHKFDSDDRAEINDLIEELKKHERMEVEDLAKELTRNAKSVVLIVDDNDITIKETVKEIRAADLSERKFVVGHKKVGLREDIPYSKQRSANSLGTGFLYKDDADQYYVVTAAHVVFPAFQRVNLSELEFISSFYVRREDENKLLTKHKFDNGVTIKKAMFFFPMKGIKELQYKLSSYGEDYIMIPLDSEKVKAAEEAGYVYVLTAADLCPEGAVLEARDVYGLGHGLGLPLKLSPCGKITKDDGGNLFSCTLDFFGGNSGSPVFDAESHKLVGMLVRGERDFYFQDGDSALSLNGLSTENQGDEICQKTNSFLRTQPSPLPKAPRISNSLGEIRSDGELGSHKDLVPYIRLEKSVEEGTDYQLYICLSSEERRIAETKMYDVGQIKVIDCFLDDLSADGEHAVAKKYKFSFSENPKNTDKTIEIRVVDRASAMYQTTVIEYANAQDSSAPLGDNRCEGVYWASYRSEEFYKKNDGETISISTGGFDENEVFKTLGTGTFKINDFEKDEPSVFVWNGVEFEKNTKTRGLERELTIELDPNKLLVFPKPDTIPPRSKPTGQGLVPLTPKANNA